MQADGPLTGAPLNFPSGGAGSSCCPPAIVPILDGVGNVVPQVVPAFVTVQAQLIVFATNLDPNGVSVEFFQRPKEPVNAAGPPTVDNVAVVAGGANFPDAVVVDFTPLPGGETDVWMVRVTNACGCCAFDALLVEIQGA